MSHPYTDFCPCTDCLREIMPGPEVVETFTIPKPQQAVIIDPHFCGCSHVHAFGGGIQDFGGRDIYLAQCHVPGCGCIQFHDLWRPGDA